LKSSSAVSRTCSVTSRWISSPLRLIDRGTEDVCEAGGPFELGHEQTVPRDGVESCAPTHARVSGVPWERDENLGHGKFGVVFSARQKGSDEDWAYALKRLQSDWLGVEEARKRFKRETDIQSSLDHPNVIPVIDAGESSTKGPWFVMPRAVDGSLKDAIKDGRASDPDWSLKVFAGVLSGVAHAHDNGVMHRDIKPGNVLMFGDVPRVADFGIARQIDNDGTTLTHTAEQLGTFRYMAPEQLRDARKAGPQADVYSLGKVLCHLLSGIQPEPFSLSLHGVPSAYRVFIDRCCRDDPSERFENAAEAHARFSRIGAPIDVRLPPVDQGRELAQAAEAALSSESQASTIDELQAHFREHSAERDLHMSVLPVIAPDLVRAWIFQSLDGFRQTIAVYDRMLEESNLAFGYCDVVARFYREIFRASDDIALKRMTMTRLILMGQRYNRFFVHDLVTELLPSLDDPCDIEITEEVIQRHPSEAAWYAATALKGSLPSPIAAAFRTAQANH
jgi:eukaryotic-like serine/threonine-protein kinase